MTSDVVMWHAVYHDPIQVSSKGQDTQRSKFVIKGKNVPFRLECTMALRSDAFLIIRRVIRAKVDGRYDLE